MNENRTIHLIDVPIGGEAGFMWNRLHGEREEICRALLNTHGVVTDEKRQRLQARLRGIDDALDRLMSKADGIPVTPSRGLISSGDVVLESLAAFDTILLRTHNSDYRLLVLDPKTGRALVDGGDYIVEPTEALVRGSAVAGDEFKSGVISIGCRLEMWVGERAFLTSPVKTVSVKHNGDAESVQDISAALH